MKSFKTSLNNLAILLVTILIYSTNLNAQTPSVQWSISYGGSGYEYASSVQQTTDGGYIAAGYSSSSDGQVAGNYGNYDYWVIKVDGNGTIQWQKNFGGSGNDIAKAVQQTADGGYIVAGYSTSTDRDVTGHHGSAGNYDFWVLKLNNAGSIEWQKSLGGTGDDEASSIRQTADGGYIVTGYTASTDGDVTGNNGYIDFWVVKINSTGGLVWQKCLGGSNDDRASSIRQTTDGGYIVAGYTSSTDGEVIGLHDPFYGFDFWVVKINSTGDIEWQKCLGGSGYDQAYSVKQTTDGGYIVAGFTGSNDGDVSGNHNSANDYWIVKLGSTGNIQWQKCLGGTSYDEAWDVVQTDDGGYVATGYVLSGNGDVIGYHGNGNYNMWLVKLSATGTLQWQKCLGGSKGDGGNAVMPTADGGLVTAGYSLSTNGDITSNHGKQDFWLVKLAGLNPSISIAASPGTSICARTPVLFTATVTNGEAGQVFTWTKNGNTVGTNSSTYTDSVFANGDSVICTLTPPGSSGVTSNTLKLAVTPVATPAVTISASSNSVVCVGTKVTFTAAVVNGGGAPALQWYKNGTPVGTNSTVYIDSLLQTNDSVKVTLTSNQVCAVPATVTSNTLPFVVATPPPTNQAPPTQWAQSFGGSGNELGFATQQTSDGGYIIAGQSSSNNGDVTGNHGAQDYWLVKVNAAGGIQWQKSYGGSSGDIAAAVRQTTDGGYIVAGYTASVDGDVVGNHGLTDVWVLKLDAAGGIVWKKCYGGSGNDKGTAVQQTTDGGYIVAGWTDSHNGDVTGNHGGQDYWVLKLDANGGIQWQKCYGGGAADEALAVQQTTDGGYVVAGYAGSNNGDVTGNHGLNDFWVLKLTGTGGIIWQKSLGGSAFDQAYAVKQTADGGYIVAGITYSNDGDVTGNHGSSDYWVVKLNNAGGLEWQKCLGGSAGEQANGVQQTSDGGYLVAGAAYSNDGDVTGNHGSFDSWVVKLNSTGAILWQKSYGGTGDDEAYAVQQTADGGYVVVGFSNSNDGDVTGNHGSLDYWAFKLTGYTPSATISASPANGICAKTPVTFNTVVTNGSVGLVYQWQKNGTAVGTNSSSYTDSMPANGDSVICTVTPPCSTIGSTSNAIKLSFAAITPPAVTISPNINGAICVGTKVKVSASPYNGGAAPSYQWYKNGLPVGADSVSYTYANWQTGDSVYVVLTSSAACASRPTATSKKLGFTVNSFVTPALSIIADAASPICAGTKVTFTATPVNGGTTPIYRWFKNNTPTGTNDVTYVDSLLKNNDSVWCTMKISGICLASSQAKSNVMHYSVNSSAKPTVTIVANKGSNICPGTRVIFTATALGSGASPFYQWLKNGTPVGTNSPTYTDSLLQTGDSVKVLLTASAACSVAPTATSNVLGFSLYQGIVPTITIKANMANPICLGTNVSFGATVTNTGTAPIYQWYKNGLPVGTNNTVYTDSTLQTGDWVKATIISNAGCAVQTPVASNTLSFTVNSKVTPYISISSGIGQLICAGQSVNFTAKAANVGSLKVFQWTKNGQNVGTNSPLYTDNSLKDGDVVQLGVTVNSGCLVTNTAVSDTLVMHVLSTPPAAPTINGPAFVTVGQSGLQFTAASATATSYTWGVPYEAAINNGQGTNTILVTWGSTAGNIRVKATNACGSSAIATQNVGVAAAPVSGKYIPAGDIKILLYPNPAHDAAKLQLAGFKATVAVTVTNMAGKLVWRQDKVANGTYTLLLAGLAQGTYLVRVDDGNISRSVKLVKAK